MVTWVNFIKKVCHAPFVFGAGNIIMKGFLLSFNRRWPRNLFHTFIRSGVEGKLI